jgi:homocysteine S-methyltransferase
VEAGADFAVTQPVFDAGQLERFLGRVRAPIPIIAGIWPLTSLRNAEFLANEVPGVHVPPAVIERMRLAQEQGTAAARAEGVAIAAEMIDAIKGLVQGIQVTAPAGRVDVALEALVNLSIHRSSTIRR